MSSDDAAFRLFRVANPYALAAIVEASTQHSVVASEDIVDERGIKLWARKQPVSASLQERLLARRLRRPLESCLLAEDGVTNVQLYFAVQTLLQGSHPVAHLARQWAKLLIEEVQRVPLHAVVQLLLTAVHSSRPEVFTHAVRCMVLAGAMQAAIGGSQIAVRVAMLAGLVHDLGEMYINPEYLAHGQDLNVAGFRHVATHPRVGELLLASLTDYPHSLARAVGEHHERLDGGGYPRRREAGDLSALGRLLATCEVAMALLSADAAPVHRTALALRMLPREFDEQHVTFMVDAARLATEGPVQINAERFAAAVDGLSDVDARLDAAGDQAQRIAADSAQPGAVREVADRVARCVLRMRQGWNAMGLWSPTALDGDEAAQFEVITVHEELQFRLRHLKRDCLWQYPEVDAIPCTPLADLWHTIEAPAPA